MIVSFVIPAHHATATFWLFDAVPWPTGPLQTAWDDLWPRVAQGIDGFLAALEACWLTPSLRNGQEGFKGVRAHGKR